MRESSHRYVNVALVGCVCVKLKNTEKKVPAKSLRMVVGESYIALKEDDVL